MTDDRSEPQTPSAPTSDQYVVVARRYRPTTFSELIGQQHVAQALTGAIDTHRVGHAYLFTGARGVGKTSTARILAKALNCQQGPTPSPCNQCEMCRSIAGGDDVDVLEIDGASNRGIDEIRQLRQNAGVRPSRARFKIYIIDEVHMLTKEAFNALLKTLEEPPEHVKFIFATTEPNKIPITILSRCQRFDFAGIQSGAIEQRLGEISQAEGVQLEPEALELLARRAAGSMRDSQSLLEQLLSMGLKTISAADVHAMLGTAPAARIQQIIAALVARDAATALAELDQAVGEGVEAGQLLEQLLGYYRDMMAAAVGCKPEQFNYASRSEAEDLSEMARQLGVNTILAAMQVLDQAATRLRGSVHSRTVTEMALVRIARLEDLDSLAAIVAALRDGQPLPAVSAAAAPSVAPKKNAPPANVAPSAKPRDPQPVTAPPTTRRFDSPEEQPVASTPAIAASTPTSAAPPASAIELSADNVADVWRRTLNNLDDLIADQAKQASRVELASGNRLFVHFAANYNFYKQVCERPDQKAILERALSQAVGSRVTLEFTVENAPAPASAGPAKPRSASVRERTAKVTEQPLVRRAMELFEVEDPRVELPDASE